MRNVKYWNFTLI